MAQQSSALPLPWGRPADASPGQNGALSIRIVPFDEGSSSRSLLSSLFRSSPRFTLEARTGVVLGQPGSAYQLEVALGPSEAAQGGEGVRVVRASIDGVEINEQLVLRHGDRQPVRFLGWLDSADGTKRLQFTFPVRGEAEIRVGVFEASEAASSDKKSGATMRAPDAAVGRGFLGPAVTDERFLLGQPVAVGVARLRAAPRE